MWIVSALRNWILKIFTHRYEKPYWEYNDPNSELCKKGILKSGWVKIRIPNYSHWSWKRDMRELEKKREELRKSTMVDMAKMKNIYFDI